MTHRSVDFFSLADTHVPVCICISGTTTGPASFGNPALILPRVTRGRAGSKAGQPGVLTQL